MSDDLFFVARNGAIWACWLSGRPAVKLGNLDEVEDAMRQFKGEHVARMPAAPAALSPAPAPPPQPPREVVERAERRHEITIIGRIYTASGSREVTILDLSERGCRFNDASVSLSTGSRLTIKLGSVGPVEAEVKWCDGNAVGVGFKTPLYPSVMAHIRDSFNLRR